MTVVLRELRRLENLIWTLFGRVSGPSSDALVRAVLANHQQDGIGTDLGQDAFVTQGDPISRTPGAPGSFAVSAFVTAIAQAGGDRVIAALERSADGGDTWTVISPSLGQVGTDANGAALFTFSPFIDSPGAGSFLYRVHLHNQTGGHSLSANAFSLLVQESL